MNKVNRLLSLLLVVLFLTGSLPLSAWASEKSADLPLSSKSYTWPLPGCETITQGYSPEEHPALDIAAEEGSPVLAVDTGTVSQIQIWDGVTLDGDQSYGNMVMISHKDGHITLYAHLSQVSVSLGDPVEKGAEIGRVGTTGNSTGPHLHLEVRTKGGNANPMDYLQSPQEDSLQDTLTEESEVSVDETNENCHEQMNEMFSGKTEQEYAENSSSDKSTLLLEENTEDIYIPLTGNELSLLTTNQNKGTLISTGDINVLTDAPATDTFGEIGTLMNKMMEYPDGSRDTAYCIEHGVEVNYPEDYENAEDLIPDPLHRRLVGDALTFGFKAEDGRIDTAEENSRYAATQMLIWEILEGGFHSSQAEKDVMTCLDYSADPAEAKSFYLSLVKNVENKYIIPSFASESAENAVPIELKWDGEKYSAAVTDSNNTLSRYQWSESDLTFNQSGNALTISAQKCLTETVRLRADYATKGGSGAVICWQNKDPSRQNIATGWSASDTVSAYIAVSCESAGWLKIIKTSEDGQVEGIPFHISGNGIEKDVVTDMNGTIQVDDLPAGTYTVTEKAANKYIQPESQQVTVSPGQVSSVSFTNILKKSIIKFEKRDAESGEIIPLAGTTVKILNVDTGEWVVQHANFPSPIDIDTFVTDATGTLMLPEPLPFGNYELYEQQSPWGYVLDKEPVPFVVDGSQDVVTVEKYNIPQKGTITVSKEGEVFSHVVESGGMYQPQYEVQGQPDAVYEITALEDVVTPDGTVHLKAGELAATLTTGSDGTATSEPLYLSRYQVKEITAPDGMVIDPEPKEVVLSYAGQEVEITSVSVGFVNERQKVEISLKKLLEQDEIFSLGMNEEWKNITFGLFAAEQLTASDGTSIPADGLMETIGIDENGNAVFKTDIPCGASLYVQEIGTDDHYILSDKKYPVVFEYAGQDVAKVEIEVNDGEAIENTLKRGKVSGWKVDQDGFELGGAVIGLFRFDETEFTEETALMVTESNEIGYFEFDKVPAGNFLVREIAPPEAFVLTEEIFPVEITEDGQTIEITIENQIIKGTAETTKVDADYPDHKLSGAVFEVYADVDNNGEFIADIDKLAGEMTETEPGLYQMKDLVYGNYFLHEKEAPEFFEKDDGYYPFSITENEAIVRIETEAGVGFLNKAQTGSLKVVKTADDDKIEGRTFKISGTDFMSNAYEQEFQTDENGEINLTLRVGEYTVSEVAGEDSDKYILPDDQTVEIKAGETTTVEMHNKLVPEVPSVPQTGDNPWMPAILGTLAGLAVLSGGALLFLRYTGKKRKSADQTDEDQGTEE